MKPIKKFLISALTIGALIVPVAAKAFVPLAAIALAIEALGSLSTPVQLSLAGHAAVIGLLSISAKDNPQHDLATKPITIQLDPNVPLTVPEGWVDDKTPPPKADYSGDYSVQIGSYPAYAASPEALLPVLHAQGWVNEVNYHASYGRCNGLPGYSVGAGEGLWRCVQGPPCPQGYERTQPGSFECSLTEPRIVVKPPKGKDEFRRVGDTFVRDQQQNIADRNTRAVLRTNRITYKDPQTDETITVELDNVTSQATITQAVPNYTNNTTSKQVSVFGSPAQGYTLNSQVTSLYAGTGSNVGENPIGGGNTGGNGNGENGFDCVQCATEVTLSNLRDITNDIKNTLNGNNPLPELAGQGVGDRLNAVQDGALTSIANDMRGMVANSGLLQAYQNNVLPMSPWAMATDGQNASCELSFTLMGKPYDISICQAQPFLHSAIAFGLFILTALGIFHLVTERPEGS